MLIISKTKQQGYDHCWANFLAEAQAPCYVRCHTGPAVFAWIRRARDLESQVCSLKTAFPVCRAWLQNDTFLVFPLWTSWKCVPWELLLLPLASTPKVLTALEKYTRMQEMFNSGGSNVEISMEISAWLCSTRFCPNHINLQLHLLCFQFRSSISQPAEMWELGNTASARRNTSPPPPTSLEHHGWVSSSRRSPHNKELQSSLKACS